MFFVGRHIDEGRRFSALQIVWRTIVVGVLASIGTAILPLPATLATKLSGSTNVGGVVYALELAVIAAIAIWALTSQWRNLREHPCAVHFASPMILAYGALYLAVMAVLWIVNLPAHFGAVDGYTANGDPIGSLWYTLLCFAIAALCIAAVATTRPTSSATVDAVVRA